jgi:hypothetical protein
MRKIKKKSPYRANEFERCVIQNNYSLDFYYIKPNAKSHFDKYKLELISTIEFILIELTSLNKFIA